MKKEEEEVGQEGGKRGKEGRERNRVRRTCTEVSRYRETSAGRSQKLLENGRPLAVAESPGAALRAVPGAGGVRVGLDL